MIYTPLTKKAMIIAFEAHKNAVDKGNVPYVFHAIHVAENMPDELTTAVALLHDVVEDSSVTCADLLEAGIVPDVVRCVDILTRRNGEDYFEYIKRVISDPCAVTVKLADLEHNCDISRLENVFDEDIERVIKYKKAIEILSQKKLKKF